MIYAIFQQYKGRIICYLVTTVPILSKTPMCAEQERQVIFKGDMLYSRETGYIHFHLMVWLSIL